MIPLTRGDNLRNAPGRLAWKLFLGQAVPAVLTTIVIGWVCAALAERHTRASIQDQLIAASTLLDLATTDGTTLQGRLHAGFGTGELRLTVIAADGTVLADSHFDPAGMADHGQREEVVAARLTGTGSATRRSDTAGIETRYFARRGTGPKPLVVRAALPLTAVEQRVRVVRLIALTTGGGIALLTLLLGVAFTRHLTRPLRQLTRNAEAIARGDRAMGIDVHQADEIGDLARTFNRMAQELDDRHARLVAERTKVETILAGMVEGVIAIDAAERVIHLNASARRLLDVAANADVVGRSIWQVCRVTAVAQAVTACLIAGKAGERDLRIGAADRERHFSLQADLLRDADGRKAGAVGVLHDITRLVQLEQVRRDFVADISHELKTPLTTVIGMIATIRDDPAMPATTRDAFLGRALVQAERLDRLTRDLLTISRLESDRPDRERHRVSLNDLVRSSRQAHAALATDAGVDLILEPVAGSIVIEGDAESLGQAIDNLVGNAVKYTPAGGRVDLSLQRRDGEAVVTVRDTGIGIPPGEHAKIFQRFYRVDKARSRERGGTGLGLAIVKHAALSHGGRVEVESAVGAGSTFRLVLPMAPPAPMSDRQ